MAMKKSVDKKKSKSAKTNVNGKSKLTQNKKSHSKHRMSEEEIVRLGELYVRETIQDYIDDGIQDWDVASAKFFSDVYNDDDHDDINHLVANVSTGVGKSVKNIFDELLVSQPKEINWSHSLASPGTEQKSDDEIIDKDPKFSYSPAGIVQSVTSNAKLSFSPKTEEQSVYSVSEEANTMKSEQSTNQFKYEISYYNEIAQPKSDNDIKATFYEPYDKTFHLNADDNKTNEEYSSPIGKLLLQSVTSNAKEILHTDEKTEQKKHDWSHPEKIKMKRYKSKNKRIIKTNSIKLQMQNLLQSKTKYRLKNESSNDIENPCDCTMDIKDLESRCEPFKRINILLKAHQLMATTKKKIKIFELIPIIDLYEHQQLHDDFVHIKLTHLDPDNDKIRQHDRHDTNAAADTHVDIQRKMCTHFAKLYPCDISKCNGFSRHYRDRHQPVLKNEHIPLSTNDVAFQDECDKIHSFFFHSTIKWGINLDQTKYDTEQELFSHTFTRYAKRRSFSRRYADSPPADSETAKQPNQPKKMKKFDVDWKKEDNKWWDHVKENEEQQDEDIYRPLVQKMNVFRWQNPHGFESGQNRATSHYKPSYSHIKEEVLQNCYQPLSKDNWNQTLRKSTVFFNSFARRRIKTKYKGFFDDQVTKHKQEWKVGETISSKEIVAFKLYTDFDKLQFQLKKCFRFETFDRILQQNDHMTEQQIKSEKQKHENAKAHLKQRLETFYHWRVQLLIVLNKYGKKLNADNNMILYHGVNAKKIIHPAQTYAFNGPLSTSASYHVARTFATAKGMILKITSHFPRLNYCNAFDASLISDYPEEQEYLVGFMYLRLLEVRTRILISKETSIKQVMQNAPMASLLRETFFAIHLFQAQIFAMSEHLEKIIAQMLKVNRKECCDSKIQTRYKHQTGQFNDWIAEAILSDCCKHANHWAGKEKLKKAVGDPQDYRHEEKENWIKKDKVAAVCWKKFEEFRKHPNVKQRVKFDKISDRLKRFFMEQINEKDIKPDKKKWIVSFEEITRVYPKVKEIHFINEYRFDDNVLRNLIKQIDRKEEEKENNLTANTIEKVVFLYYNYKNTNEDDINNKPINELVFKDPDTLNSELIAELKKRGWDIKHGKNGDTGYKIRIEP